MRTLAAFAGLVSAVALGALAWNTTQTKADDATSLSSFTVSNVSGVLTSIGATDIKSGSVADGSRYITFNAGGNNYLMALYACDKTHSSCIGLQIEALFEAAAYSQQVINKFNATYPFGKAYILTDGTLVSSRYFIADDGIPRKNVTSEIQNFFGMTNILIDFIKKSGVVASLPGGTQPVSYPGGTSGMNGKTHAEAATLLAKPVRINRLRP